jgi:hypothetical protein
MRHVSIGFLPEGFQSLHRFLSLSNRQECPAANSTVCSKSYGGNWVMTR